MCLTIPGKIIQIKKDSYTIDYGSEKRQVQTSLVDIKVGEYVIVTNKIIVAKIPKEDAIKFLEITKTNHGLGR